MKIVDFLTRLEFLERLPTQENFVRFGNHICIRRDATRHDAIDIITITNAFILIGK